MIAMMNQSRKLGAVLAIYLVGLLIGGFTPNMYEAVTLYTPTLREISVTIGVYAVGALVLSLLWKIALGVKFEVGHTNGDAE